MPFAASAPPACTYLAALTDLLGTFPEQRDWGQAETVRERLDELGYGACWDGVPEATLAAIRGARILLAIAGSPPPRGLITGRAASARTDPRR